MFLLLLALLVDVFAAFSGLTFELREELDRVSDNNGEHTMMAVLWR
jgi:hypothetical protein